MSKPGDKMAAAVKRRTEPAVKNVLFYLFRALTTRTPVISGRARAGWTLSGGSPSSYVPAPGRHGANEPPDIDVKLGTTYYISNNLPYIQRLDDGWSQQAPAGIVDLAIAATKRRFRK